MPSKMELKIYKLNMDKNRELLPGIIISKSFLHDNLLVTPS